MFFGRSFETIICFRNLLTFSKVEFFRSFFGRIEEIINCFRDLLTFSNFSHTQVFGAKKSEHGLFSTI